MKTGFSSLVCPDWDFATMVSKAAELGFDGVELCMNRDARISSQVASVAADPDAARKRLDDANVRLLCLGASFPLESPFKNEVQDQLKGSTDTIELAGRLGCPYVRVPFGRCRWLDTQPHVLSRVSEAFQTLVPAAVASGVTVLAENGGDLPTSTDVWFILDAVSHPAIRCCWNPCVALGVGERPTISIPRLARGIAMVHVCDATFDERGAFQEYNLPGEGSVEWESTIRLLRGVFFDGAFVFHWPKALDPSLPEPDEVLPKVVAHLRARIDEKQEPLAAYKKDKHAPNYGTASTGSPA